MQSDIVVGKYQTLIIRGYTSLIREKSYDSNPLKPFLSKRHQLDVVQ